MVESLEQIRVLHLDDERDFVEMAARFLEREEDLNVETAVNPDEAEKRLGNGDFDCIICDHDMPSRNGIELLRNVREEHPNLPFILFTGKGSEEVASEAISAGVTDYLQKQSGTEQYELLANRVRNVVQQNRATQAVRETEEWSSKLLEHSSDYLLVVDATGTVSYASPSVHRVIGFEQAEIVGTSAFEYIHPKDVELAMEAFSELIDDPDREVTVKYRAEHANGDYRWIQVRGRNLLDDPAVEGILVNVRDITESEAQNRAFDSFLDIVNDPDRSFERKMQDVLDLGRDFLGLEYGIISQIEPPVYHVKYVATPDGSISADDTFDYDNTYCELVYGTEEPAAFRNPEEGGVQQHPCYREMGLEAYLGQLLVVDDERYGTLNFSSPSARESSFSDGETAFIRTMAEWIGKEISRQQYLDRIETQQTEVERQNERLEQFASFVSHDLRNSLSVAQGRVELAREQFDGEDLERAQRALERSQNVIEDLLALARDQAGISEVEAVDLRDIVERCWKYVDTAEASIETLTDAEIQANPGRLQRLFENLFRNAVEHGGAEVSITVGEFEGGFYFEDDGVGIPESDRDQVFEMGYSTGEEGTGLGLKIVQEIADTHGWVIEIKSSEAGGARFEFNGIERIN